MSDLSDQLIRITQMFRPFGQKQKHLLYFHRQFYDATMYHMYVLQFWIQSFT